MDDSFLPEGADGGLLPAGLADSLPPQASREEALVWRLLSGFAAQGYELIKPPLVEFEETLLSGTGAAMRPHCFRLMDPVSQRMMGVRPDITPQVARIARTRLQHAPRPLRLCYAGEVLRVRGSQLRPARQFEQVGAELIGAASATSDAEVVALAASALESIGVAGLSVDLTVPTLVPAMADSMGLEPGRTRRLREALDRKDAAAVEAAMEGASPGAAAPFAALLRAAGPADKAMAALGRIALPPAALAERDRLAEVIALIRAALPELRLTVDPVEMRGFEYERGVSFTFFARRAAADPPECLSKGVDSHDGARINARQVHGDLGRGGRYAAAAEPATGFTLYMDSVVRALPAAEQPRRVYLPAGTPHDVARRLRQEGWITVAGLEPAADAAAEARRLGCLHRWSGAAIVAA